MDKDRFFELALSFSRVKNLSNLEFVYGFQRPDKSLAYFIIRQSKMFVSTDLSAINIYDRLRSDFIILDGFARSELLHSFNGLVLEVLERNKVCAHEIQDLINYCMVHRIKFQNLVLIPVGSKVEALSGKMSLEFDSLRLLCEALEAFFFVYDSAFKIRPLLPVHYEQIQSRTISACLLDDNKNKRNTELSLESFPFPFIKPCFIPNFATVDFFKNQVKRGCWLIDILVLPTSIASVTQSTVSSDIYPLALLIVDPTVTKVFSFSQFVSDSQLIRLLVGQCYERGLPATIFCNTPRTYQMLGRAITQLSVKAIYQPMEEVLFPLKRMVWNAIAYNNKSLKRYTHLEESLEEDFLNELMLEEVSRSPKKRDELIKNIAREDFSLTQYRHRFDLKLKKRRARRFLGDASRKLALCLYENIKKGGFTGTFVQDFYNAMND